MNAADIIRKARQGAVAQIDRDELVHLLGECEAVREVDTRLAGWIRVLVLDRQIAVQEETPDGEVLLRAFETLEAAGAFVDGRLADYDRMWDGCGCKIDYHS